MLPVLVFQLSKIRTENRTRTTSSAALGTLLGCTQENKRHSLGVKVPQAGPLFFAGNSQESPRQTKPKKGQFMNFSRGHSGTEVRCVIVFPTEKTPEFTKMGENSYELFVLALSLVWFAGANSNQILPKTAFSGCQFKGGQEDLHRQRGGESQKIGR